jgi:MarR family transcriptional regulator, transcriptional regulator for hemolysin
LTSSNDHDPRANFGRLVAHAARQWRRAVDLRLRPFGLTEATWLPLVHVSRAEKPMRQKDLAALLSLDNSSVVRLLDALQAAGFVERRDEPSDRRVKTIHLTSTARSVLDQVEAVSWAVRTETLAGISDADLATASHVLQQICAVLAATGSEGDE